jgi:hypothetical protein
MPAPNPFPCGGIGQKPCPPEPAVILLGEKFAYTKTEMHAYGDACYLKGRQDEAAGVPLAGESGQ